MKATTKLGTIIATLATAGNAIAATGAREDTSGLFVWIFLGVCALIVVAQVVPAALMMLGAAKGVARAIREHRQAPVESEVKTR